MLAFAWVTRSASQQFTSAFVQELVDRSSEIAASAEQHLAYPILHTFHSGHPDTTAPFALAHSDDAIRLLAAGVVSSALPDANGILVLRHTLDRYMTTARATVRADPAQDPPTLRHLGRLRRLRDPGRG